MMSNNNWVGRTLGKVQVESLLARGGVAEVYLGTHITLHRKVAVKLLRNPGDEHSDSLERFQREARVVASLRHPNIVQVYDFDMIEGDPYLVMEYIQGPSLSKYLHFLFQRNEMLEIPPIVRLLNGVAGALEYAHRNGIIHRDIKPGNILLTSPTTRIEIDKPLPDDFEPVLTDFGLVRFIDSARQTSTGVTAGTPAYMSPEQARGETTDGRTDIYSLGIVLYEVLAGRLPFDGETTMSILLKHVNEPPPSIPGLSPHIQIVLDRALAKDPANRYQTPLDFARAFNNAVENNPDTMQVASLATLGPSTIDAEPLVGEVVLDFPKHSKKSVRMRFVAGVLIAIAAGAFILLNGLPFLAPPAEETLTPTNSEIPASPSSTNTSTLTPIPSILGSIGILRFQNGNSTGDSVILKAQLMPAAPAGNQYEVWLVNPRQRISIGILSLDETGSGELIYTDENGANLIAMYNGMEITVEPEPDTNKTPTKLVAYSFTLPADGLTHVLNLLASFPNTPSKVGLSNGFYISMNQLNNMAQEMLNAHENNDDILVRQYAEGMLNLVTGAKSTDYKDWDLDGFITDNSDGYGFVLNGSNYGYLQAIYDEAEFTVNTPGASQQMIAHGKYVQVGIQNLAEWTSQLQILLVGVINAPVGTDIEKQVSEIAALVDQMLNGVDMNTNGVVEPLAGEAGAVTTYNESFYMADMPLLRVGVFGDFTPTGTFSGTSTGGGGGGGGVVEPTKKPPPGQNKTDKPAPTKKNNGNNN